jgi:hypothetical protein
MARSFHGPTKILEKANSSILGEYFTDSKYVASHFACVSSLMSLTQTAVGPDGLSTTTLYRALRKNKEERVARLEWAPNGGLGRAQIGKVGLHVLHHIGVVLKYLRRTEYSVDARPCPTRFSRPR